MNGRERSEENNYIHNSLKNFKYLGVKQRKGKTSTVKTIKH
jgi:hypothetical protein